MPGWSGPCQTRALSRGYLGGPEPPLSLPVPQHSPARGGQGRGREASDCLCGLVPLGTAGVTWTHALPNTYTRADTDSSTHTNQHPPTSIHQILTQHKHTHTHTHTCARAHIPTRKQMPPPKQIPLSWPSIQRPTGRQGYYYLVVIMIVLRKVSTRQKTSNSGQQPQIAQATGPMGLFPVQTCLLVCKNDLLLIYD